MPGVTFMMMCGGGVCADHVSVTVSPDGVIERVDIAGGCSGYSRAMMALLPGLDAEFAVSRMKDVKCGDNRESCPAKIAEALGAALATINARKKEGVTDGKNE